MNTHHTHDAQSNDDTHPVENLLTTERAARFAQRMIETWPTGPRRNVWHHIALECHDTTALKQAYRDLERTVHHISTAHFYAAYNAAKRKTTPTNPTDKCPDCDGTGWTDTTPEPTDTTPVPSSKSTPCTHCDRGRQMIDTQRRIHDANRR